MSGEKNTQVAGAAENPAVASGKNSPTKQQTNANDTEKSPAGKTAKDSTKEASETTAAAPSATVHLDNGSTNYSTTAQQIDVDGTNLYVKGFPLEMNDESLLTTFSPYGDVTEHRIMRDLTTKVSLGYGFVRFSRRSEAQQAISALNGYTISATPMIVKVADKQGKTLGNPNDNVYVKQVPLNWEEQHLKALFQPFGSIQNVIVLRDMQTKKSRGLGFVRFSSIAEATAAVQALAGYQPNEPGAEKMIVQYAESESEKERRSANKMSRRHTNNTNHQYNSYNNNNSTSYGGNMNHQYGGYGQQHGGVAAGNMGGYGAPATGGAAIGAYGEYNPQQQGYDQQSYGGGGGSMSRRASNNQRYSPYGAQGGMGGQGMGMGMGNSMGGGGVAPGSTADNTNLFIFHLPFEIDEAQLYALFIPFGALSSVKIAKDPAGASKGYGFVNFVNAAEAANAIQMMNGYKIGNKYLKVALKKK